MAEKKVSLLQRESTGGDIAEGGFSFQDGMLVASIPRFLALDGFTSVNREGVGDIEIKFFTPEFGIQIELFEAKDHRVTPSEFWAEIERFQEIDTSAPGTYRCFTLVCTDLGDAAKTCYNALKRVRDPYEFYGADCPIAKESYDDFVSVVEKCDKTKADADFLFHKVRILPNNAGTADNAKGYFLNEAQWFIKELSVSVSHLIYDSLFSLIKAHKNTPLHRNDIVNTISDVADNNELLPKAVRVFTLSSNTDGCSGPLEFNWEGFTGGQGREYPSPAKWKEQVVDKLQGTKEWITENELSRRIKLQGHRRLSSSVAIGCIFSATAGFTVEANVKEEVWSTDQHANKDTPNYRFHNSISKESDPSDDLILSIGIIREISKSVEQSTDELGISGMTLSMYGSEPVVSAEQANLIVRKVKSEIDNAGKHGTLHLFLACPSQLAIFLGHRLNATMTVQCYEWDGSGYARTCKLSS